MASSVTDVRHRSRPPLLVLGAASLLLAACSSTTASPAPTAPAHVLDCAKVASLKHEITAAQATMVDSGTTSSSQVAADAATIAKATASLGALSAAALPRDTAVWVRTTNAYAVQMAGGARNGTDVGQLLMDAHAFDSHEYQRAAQAVGTFFSSACPG